MVHISTVYQIIDRGHNSEHIDCFVNRIFEYWRQESTRKLWNARSNRSNFYKQSFFYQTLSLTKNNIVNFLVFEMGQKPYF